METATASTVVIRNKGQRTYQLPNGPDGEKRFLAPNQALQVTEAEAKQYLGYQDIEDMAKVLPQSAEVIASLRAENAALRATRDAKLAEAKKAAEPVPGSQDAPAAAKTAPRVAKRKAAAK